MLKQNNNDTEENGRNKLYSEQDQLLWKKGNFDNENDFEKRFKEMPLTEDTTCGIPFFQRFANKKAFVIFYGLVGCIYTATYAYFNGTITTLEKRFKIPSKTSGIISVGNDISSLFASIIISYYAGKGHKPRWLALGLYTVVLFCLMTALPHIIYGPGQDALGLTLEHGAVYDQNTTIEVLNEQRKKNLCHLDGSGTKCEVKEGSLAPQIILFAAQFISGIGGSLYYTLGISYMDDNVKKSKTPALMSFSIFLRTLGPAVGYALSSLCLKFFISPSLTPVINNTDMRWLGAWWVGWLILGGILFIFATILGMFPKTLPRAALRRQIALEKKNIDENETKNDPPASMKDMVVTIKRLVRNKILMLNVFTSVFYFFGYMAYWIFLPKYIEIQYRQSASIASLMTGTVGLVFSAIGILSSGVVITKLKPGGRALAGWNTFVGALSVVWMVLFVFLGCSANDNNIVINSTPTNNSVATCNSNCKCDFVPYFPVCSADGATTFISACHAGCRDHFEDNNKKIFTNCSCIDADKFDKNSIFFDKVPSEVVKQNIGNKSGFAIPGSCPVDCSKQFYIFLAVVCLMKFTSATGRASNFLIAVRCVDPKDKPMSMALALMIFSLLTLIPAPIFFGAILDKTCLVWGKTCTGTGNCWLYDVESLRYLLNLTAAAFVAIGTLFDVGVWYFIKDLKMYDEDDNVKSDLEMKNIGSKKDQRSVLQ
ncbi:solute carrier organic anion transporter family member 5A1-like [Ctenocephalides felis]|uniref:solute carrier organic anion transporter family member 5A1-like n=1 Tax=Ctenocephalides felis TaxID=7515 RepID=UPI000E6E2DC7|nr:solute carrier organic anion transporter family member 5A1-like [Ctenocephalides felis]